MVSIVNTKIFESIPERDGRKYVTIELTTEFGDKRVYKNVLLAADVDAVEYARELEEVFIAHLQEEEKSKAYRLAIEEGVNPSTLVFKYNVKAAVINDLYSSKVTPEAEEAAARLTKLQNAKNRIGMFLGLF